jgi:cell wall-associated protease
MKTTLFASLFLVGFTAFSQEKTEINWQLEDPSSDHLYGVSVEKAYALLKGRTAKTIIVAVIDGGTDINHEDLKANIWTNTGEIPDNGIDDDHNGYIDDVHGWSFLGSKKGNIDHESNESTRIYQKLKPKYDKLDSTQVSAADMVEYRQFSKIKTEFLKDQQQQRGEIMALKIIKRMIDNVKKDNKGEFTKKGLTAYQPNDDIEKEFKKILSKAMNYGGKADELEKAFIGELKRAEQSIYFSKVNSDSLRRAIVGDNPDDPNEHNYGCNDVTGPEALHGTHVAGIIGAVRNNNLGINGIADHVKLMILRAVPDGDERDKDIANAIRYAVDNGASIINMSFGKYYSPDKGVIDEAIKYAAAHDVLLIHAAGNESNDIDKETGYPTRRLNSGESMKNWIEVGASSSHKGSIFHASNLVGNFSNYGKTQVEFFAPGVNIYSTLPNNAYGNETGTSMAAPVTTGVAAIIREYFPELKAEEVRNILIKSTYPFTKKIILPGPTKKKGHLKDISVTGGIVNAEAAVKMLMKK